MFSCEYCEIFKNNFFIRTTPVTAFKQINRLAPFIAISMTMHDKLNIKTFSIQ